MRAKNRLFKIMIAVFLLFGLIIPQNGSNITMAEAATQSESKTVNYITTADFIELLVKAIKLEVNQEVLDPYIIAAYNAKILEQGDVKSFEGNITRAECAVLLNRADEYLHGDTLDEKYVQKILDRRISDINHIDKEKREAVAKVYGKGIIKGYSNGYGVQSREFRGDHYVTKKSANSFIDLVLHPKKRAKLSPDAQLIRTTNLPKNADKFDYILECFPNAFYEKKFDWKFIISSTAPILEGEDYDYPINIRKRKLLNSVTEFDMGEQMDLYLYDWADYIEKYANLIFNVNYKTIGNKWIASVKDVMSSTNMTDTFMERYIANVKKYHVTVETRKIAVEPSTLYYSDTYFMRVYLEYRITANEFVDDIRAYIFSQGGNVDFELGEWTTSYLDFELGNFDGRYGDGSTMCAYRTWYESD